MRPAIVWGASLGSLLLHVFGAWRVSLEAPRTPARVADARGVELTLVELSPSGPATRDSLPLPAPPPVIDRTTGEHDRRSRTSSARASLSEGAPEISVASEPSSASSAGVDDERVALAPTAVPTDLDAAPVGAEAPATREVARSQAGMATPYGLSPAAAAATLADELLAAPSARSCRRAFADAALGCDDAAPSAGERLQRSLDDAATRIPHLAPRPPPEIKRDTNGDYHYEGTAFTGLIRRDGTVSITDRANIQSAPIPLGGTFDLYDAIEKHVLGKELYSAEKRWFLEHTAELRHTLSDAAHATRLAQGSLRLRGRLEAIVRDGSLPDARKRELVFELWDDCAPDGVGEQAQRVVEQFIRERMAAGSPLAYDSAELARLNRGRASVRAFDPYAVSDAGAPG